ncbi:ATP-binding protein [Arthrobacter zhaoguopingii]|uniref:ATP-binding protein n=1 Tax=Arthrobacter zhaoguopingii TaxID=2681491 RepID=UPI00135AB142|nr:ATP-binding protein [Arthrobacter zhaoguopingii]
MDESMGKFLSDFAALVELAQAQGPRGPQGEQLVPLLSEHLGRPAPEVPVVLEQVPSHRFVDLDIVLAGEAGKDPAARLVGIGGGDQRHHLSLSDMLQQQQFFPRLPLSQPDYTNVAVGPDAQRQAVALGVWLFTRDGVPLVVLQRSASPQYGRMTASLEVLSPDPGATDSFLAELRRQLQSDSVLKGQVISLTMDDYGQGSAGVTFHHRPALGEADVILPEGLLQKISDHAVGVAAHRAALKALDQHLKRGILLYGPPGTGKTHTVRYLLGRTGGTTAILLSGGTLAFVSEAARMARALQPSVVVLEDCDLIAEDRSYGHGPQPLLFEVLDAMDGLDDDADVTFVLTTNRVDMLERALAERPGRVDLAVNIPLPSERERIELLRLYSRRIRFSEEALAAAAARIEGTTASFVRELVRRAVLGAQLAGADVSDVHLEAAVEELMADGATLTRSLLGSQHRPNSPAGQGYPPGPGTAPGPGFFPGQEFPPGDWAHHGPVG